MTRFGTFATLYMAAIFLDLAHAWRYPAYTLVVLLFILALLAIGITRITFLIFLVVTTLHFVVVQLPDIPNHAAVEIWSNLLMALGIVYSLRRAREFPTDDDYFEMTRPPLRATMVVVYVLAGFHKMNADFLRPEVSCAGDLVGRLARVARADVAGIPAVLLLAAGLALVVYLLARSRGPGRAMRRLSGVGVIALFAAATAFALRLTPGVHTTPGKAITLLMAGTVILWEFLGGLLLTIPRLQAPLLAVSWTMHATLNLIGFVDFSSLVFALLFTFVPRPYLDLVDSRLRLPILGLSAHRAHVYFAVSVLAGVSSAWHGTLVAGLLYDAATLVVIWPLLSAWAAPPRPVWTGTPLIARTTPAWLFTFPALLVPYGLTSYLGLRTAGNFSMFSNLRTEGPRSNHLLLGRNPLKVWHYQEDVVHFLRIDDRKAGIGYHYEPLQGYRLPVVEFRKLIYAWTRAGVTVPMAFEYRGRRYSTENIVTEPAWRADRRDWEMRLMDFRVIQPEGPNRCRW